MNIQTASSSLLIIFLLISFNFTGTIINCSLQRLFKMSRISKLIVIFFSLFIFVILSNNSNKNENPFITLRNTLILFIIFILATKNKPFITTLFLLLWFIIYFIELYKKYKYPYVKNTKNIENMYIFGNNKKRFKESHTDNLDMYILLHNLQFIIFCLSLILLLLGFILYYLKKKEEYGNEWSNITFFIGSHKCKSVR